MTTSSDSPFVNEPLPERYHLQVLAYDSRSNLEARVVQATGPSKSHLFKRAQELAYSFAGKLGYDVGVVKRLVLLAHPQYDFISHVFRVAECAGRHLPECDGSCLGT